DIARDEILPQYRNLLPVAQDLLLERHRDLEMLGVLLGAVFLHGVEHRAHQHNRRNDDEACQIAGERGNHRRRQQNDHERVAKPTEEFERQRQTPPLLKGVRAIAEPACGGLGGAEAVSAGSELPLEIGERDLPEFPLGPAIRCHRQWHRQLVRSGYSDAGEWQWALGFIANPYYRFRPRPEIFGSSK